MSERTADPQSTARATSQARPPVVRRTASRVVVGLLLVLWAVVTFGARALTPPIRDVAERVEVALGLDVATGPRKRADDEAKE